MNLKKLLACFAISGVLCSLSSPVIACLPKPQQIIKKITNKNVSIPISFNTRTEKIERSVFASKKAINSALQKVNSKLTDNDLNHLSYSNEQLIVNQSVEVTVTATVDKKTSSTTIMVTLAESPQAIIDKIKKITEPIDVVFNKDIKANTVANTHNINQALIAKYQSLALDQVPITPFVNFLTYQGSLTPGGSASITVTATVGKVQAHGNLKIAMLTPMATAKAIQKKIENKSVEINDNASVEASDRANSRNINWALRNEIPTLTDQDIKSFRYLANLERGKSVKTQVAISSNDKVQVLTFIHVKMASSKAQYIIDKITKPDHLFIEYNYQQKFDPNSPDNQDNIDAALQSQNPNLTYSDLLKLSYNGGPLIPGQAVKVTVTAKIDDSQPTAQTSIDVTMRERV